MEEIEKDKYILKRRTVNILNLISKDKQINFEENCKMEKEENKIYESQTKELVNFEKIIFKVKVLKIMNRKSDKVIEIYNTKDGFLKISNMNNVNFYKLFSRLKT